MARVSSIHRVYRPGLYRMEVALGDLGFDVDVAEAAVKKVVAEVEPPVESVECSMDSDCPDGYVCVNGRCTPRSTTPQPTKVMTPADWTDIIVQQVKEGWIVPNANVPGIAPNLPIGATKSTLEKPLNILPTDLAKLNASNVSRLANVNLFIEFTSLNRMGSARTLAENIRFGAVRQELIKRGYAL